MTPYETLLHFSTLLGAGMVIERRDTPAVGDEKSAYRDVLVLINRYHNWHSLLVHGNTLYYLYQYYKGGGNNRVIASRSLDTVTTKEDLIDFIDNSLAKLIVIRASKLEQAAARLRAEAGPCPKYLSDVLKKARFTKQIGGS